MDLTKIALIEFEPEAYVDCINDFTVDTSGLPPDQRADIQCDISGPDGSPVDCFVNKMGPDGPYQVIISIIIALHGNILMNKYLKHFNLILYFNTHQ